MEGIRRSQPNDPASAAVFDLAAARRRKAQASEPPKGDAVEITEAGRELARASDITNAMSDVRQERVEALKQRVQDGSYALDPATIARRILEDEA